MKLHNRVIYILSSLSLSLNRECSILSNLLIIISNILFILFSYSVLTISQKQSYYTTRILCSKPNNIIAVWVSRIISVVFSEIIFILIATEHL